MKIGSLRLEDYPHQTWSVWSNPAQQACADDLRRAYEAQFMTITVSIPDAGSERDACECGVAKAKDFARHFADVPLQQFPLPAPRVG